MQRCLVLSLSIVYWKCDADWSRTEQNFCLAWCWPASACVSNHCWNVDLRWKRRRKKKNENDRYQSLTHERLKMTYPLLFPVPIVFVAATLHVYKITFIGIFSSCPTPATSQSSIWPCFPILACGGIFWVLFLMLSVIIAYSYCQFPYQYCDIQKTHQQPEAFFHLPRDMYM